MKLAGVVVLYNPDSKVKKNIDSYIKYLDKLYIVDNSNNDMIFDYKDKKVEYIKNNKNLGIASALNIAAKKAISDKFEWLLTMDQDSMFEKDEFPKMIEFLEKIKTDPYIQMINTTTYDEIGLISPLHKTVMNENGNEQGIEFPETVMTSGNIINLSAYKKVGGYKDWFFIDGVDFEYCLNLKMHGFKVMRLNFVYLKHNLGDAITKNIFGKKIYSLNHSPLRRYYIIRNKHYLYDLYGKQEKEYCKFELKKIRHETIKMLLCEKHRIKKLSYMFKGYIDYKLGKKGEKK